MSTMTIEQLKLEAQQAAKKLQEAEETAAREARDAKAALERAEREAKEAELKEKAVAFIRPIKEALLDAGVQCTLNTSQFNNFPSINVMGSGGERPDADLEVTIEREMSKSSGWRSFYTGHFVICVGQNYSDLKRVRYPQNKAGLFNIDKIVAMVTTRIKDKAEAEAEAKKKAVELKRKQSLAQTLQEELGVGEDRISATLDLSGHNYRGRYETKHYTAEDGYVFVKVGTPMLNPAQARVLVKALAEVKRLANKKEGA